MYLSSIAKCICPNWEENGTTGEAVVKIAAGLLPKIICLQSPNVFVFNCKMYLSQLGREWNNW